RLIMARIVICDLDRTLADCSHRAHFLEREPKDWEGFFATQNDDLVIKPILELLDCVSEKGHQIHIVTARPERYRAVTAEWLKRHVVDWIAILMDGYRLHMRPDGDFRDDDIIKEEVLDRIGPENVLFAIEDRDRIVAMYRRRGVVCLQCADGDF